MIVDGIEAFRTTGFQPQVVVIGAGPAGITLARRLASSNVPCALLDAGGEEYSQDTQDVYQGKTIGDPYFDLEAARLRYLGGTSGHWAGWCRFLDAHDFEKRDWIPNSGWPIDRNAIEPFFEAARDVLGLRKFEPDEGISNDINWIDLIRSEPVRFGEKYRDELAKSDSICVVLNTYATDFEADDKQVTAANVVSNRKPSGHISAPYFVAATGGIENSRLLLWSNEKSGDPVVPNATSLGRYWMEHPEFTVGDALILRPEAYPHESDGVAFFAPTQHAMKKNEIMNFHAVIRPLEYSSTKQMVSDLMCAMPDTSEWLVGLTGKSLNCYGNRVSMAWEQSPEFDNRVALSATDKDFAGVPRVELHWRKGNLDRKTMSEGARLFGTTLALKDIGRMRLDEWVRDAKDYPEDGEIGGYHHMGGTRMSSDPNTGVVDANCRVHGMSNLYVAGSSIFTTSGYANPTASIVAFSERLGVHLAEQIN